MKPIIRDGIVNRTVLRFINEKLFISFRIEFVEANSLVINDVGKFSNES